MNYAKVIKSCCQMLLLMAAIPAWAAGTPPAAIKVGTLYASSGVFSSISLPVYNGLKLWVNQVNAHGGVFVKPYDKKIPVKLIAYDDQSSTSTATTLYNQLITKDHVNIFVADSGSVLTSVAVPIAEEHKQLLFDQTGTGANFFSASNPYIVLLDDPMSTLWPRYLADFLEKDAVKHGIKTVAILYSTNDFTGSQAAALKEDLQKGRSGLKIVFDQGVPTSTSNYMILIHRIKASGADALIEMGYPDNDISFLRNLQSSNLKFPMLFTLYTGIETELLHKTVGAKAMIGNFTYVTATGLTYKISYGMSLPEFETAYRAAYGKSADIGFNSIAGYDTGVVIEKALAATSSMDQLALRKAVMGLSGKLVTLDGQFKLDKNGAQTGELFPIGQIQPQGKGIRLVPVYPPQVAAGSPDWSGSSKTH